MGSHGLACSFGVTCLVTLFLMLYVAKRREMFSSPIFPRQIFGIPRLTEGCLTMLVVESIAVGFLSMIGVLVATLAVTRCACRRPRTPTRTVKRERPEKNDKAQA